MKIFVQVQENDVIGWSEVHPDAKAIDFEFALLNAKQHLKEVQGRVKELADIIDGQAVQSFGTD